MSNGSPARLRRFVGEFTVVVLGVLVALFMESAWEDRQERLLAREYVERLREETRLNREEFSLDVGFNAVHCQAAGEAFDGLNGGTGSSSEDLLRSIWITALNRTPRYRHTTYEDLVASGRIGIIREAEVRDRIIDYYTYDLGASRPVRDDDYRRNVLATLPPDWTSEMVRSCATVTGMREDWESCWVPVEDGAERWVERVSELPEIRRQLAQRTYDICNFDRFLAEADSILAGLEEAMGATP
ncbi:MAG TPA: hypothetical protein VK858_02835 [Longimicrobiales bacterium]|nr:hypothetical protein [Longimicrobiales bacterium]